MNPAAPPAFGLYLVLTEPVAGYEACVAAAVRAGLRYVQLRRKNKPRPETLAIARRLRRITAGSATLFMVNDDVEIAADSDADGVHLGQDDMGLAAARARWPAPGKVFGLSTHNEDQERSARELAPDYIGVGPVFATPTKEQPDPVLGLERMGRIVRASPLATVPIGGIDGRNLPAVLGQGAVNFCVLRAVNLDPDPLSAISGLQAIWRARVGCAMDSPGWTRESRSATQI